MFGPLIDLLVLFSVFTLLMVAWKFWQQRADEKLRDNPPQRRIVEVSLPVGVGDSASSMARFYRKAANAALGDKGTRKSGYRQIDFVYIVDVPAEGALPRMRCRIYADPDKMDAVKKSLKSSFQEAIDLVELSEDDLLPIAQIIRPPEDKESPEEDLVVDAEPAEPAQITAASEVEQFESVELDGDVNSQEASPQDIQAMLDQLNQEAISEQEMTAENNTNLEDLLEDLNLEDLLEDLPEVSTSSEIIDNSNLSETKEETEIVSEPADDTEIIDPEVVAAVENSEDDDKPQISFGEVDLPASLQEVEAVDFQLEEGDILPEEAPSFAEPEEAPSFAEPEEGPSFAGPEEGPSFAEPEGAPSFAGPEEAPSFAEPEEGPSFAGPEEAPSFAEPEEVLEENTSNEEIFEPEEFDLPKRENASQAPKIEFVIDEEDD